MHADRPSAPPAPAVVTPANDDAETKRRAADVASRLRLALADPAELPGADTLLLVVHRDRLELAESSAPRQRAIAIDFVAGTTAYRRIAARGKRELIARAVGDRARHRRIIDATAGLARDAFLLATLGYEVVALERSAVLAEMAQDALARAAAFAQADLHTITARLQVMHAEAADYLAGLAPADRPDVIYVDPMYETSHGSALAKKELRVLRRLVGDDPDATALLAVAQATARRRVVVKRHRHAPPLAGGVSHAILGTRVRYDVYMIAADHNNR